MFHAVNVLAHFERRHLLECPRDGIAVTRKSKCASRLHDHQSAFPALRVILRTNLAMTPDARGSQVPGPSSSCVPWSSTPPGAYRPSPISRCGRCCLQATQCLRHPEACFFRGYLPTAHSLACLRFAESVTVPGARLATGRAGSPFAGRVSHPLDDKQGFMGSSHTPFPLDQPCLVALGLEPT